ncbi:MAG: phage major capsid protein [Ruminococcaceae bacterium]|nr:phage major capsid protein [Oscillospiraceae bacterium]
MTISELREKRNKAWEAAKAFVETKRDADGLMTAEDAATYAQMEQKVQDYSTEIDRMERQEAIDRQMNAPTSTPITGKPATAKVDTKPGRAADAYKTSFWNQMRNKTSVEVRNALSVGVDADGGYLVPDTFEKQLIAALNDQMVVRKLSHTFITACGVHKIPVVTSHGTANWVEEAGEIPETTETFGQQYIGAHKLTALIKISEELLNDAAFNLEEYFQKEFTKRITNAEEVAFLTGDGNGKPTGLLDADTGAEVGVTTASATEITADDVINLYYSLRAPYRSKAVWLLNDSTVNALRLLKDKNGQFIWQPSLKDGTPDMLLGRPVYTSTAFPSIGAGQKAIAFGDLSYYWIGDREGITFRRLNELYAAKGQVGFLATKRVDAKLILPEAVKVLQLGSAS